ncbi:putative Mg2+ transporter-C (MgtC) family protein [Roseibium hamelinense]|uniref:Protein MgtC n=1 Tax=Roseibium hamelinense TaxID=150831 RepID=A0A562TIR3_9HYPH|nr:MgtC/SapB family protein [Roseibium hamelinense]MTI45625.1 MgtC/SapB family protein [Roseibium hamelinense]TWI93194.1 putative Mg2+ transporter-C (MgtC) family protein [Roseibium hamelinense]
MLFIQNFNSVSMADSFVSLLAAFVLGTIIGAERQYRQRSAGLRTNVLVALGAAAFVDLAFIVSTDADSATRVISYVVSGVGFLGAGVIMKDGADVRGLNTAATLWASAAVGACAGADMIAEAVMVTGFVIAGNTLLRPLVNWINRAPLNEEQSEAIYEVLIIAEASHVSEVREAVILELNKARYPVADIRQSALSDSLIEITAVLVSTSVDRKELNAAVNTLREMPVVSRARWEASTTD